MERTSGAGLVVAVPAFLLFVAVAVGAAEASGVWSRPFEHVRLVAGLVLLCGGLAVLASGSAWRPLRDLAWMRAVAAWALVTVLLGVVAVITASAEALVGAVLLTALLGMLAGVHRWTRRHRRP